MREIQIFIQIFIQISGGRRYKFYLALAYTRRGATPTPHHSKVAPYNFGSYPYRLMTLGFILLAGTLFATAVFGSPPGRSSRICRPPPPHPENGSLPVCLVVGDSVSIGMTGGVAAALAGRCAVVHAPFSGDGGACDTNYGLQCADLWLGSTLDGSPAPKFAAITFNFGEGGPSPIVDGWKPPSTSTNRPPSPTHTHTHLFPGLLFVPLISPLRAHPVPLLHLSLIICEQSSSHRSGPLPGFRLQRAT